MKLTKRVPNRWKIYKEYLQSWVRKKVVTGHSWETEYGKWVDIILQGFLIRDNSIDWFNFNIFKRGLYNDLNKFYGISSNF